MLDSASCLSQPKLIKSFKLSFACCEIRYSLHKVRSIPLILVIFLQMDNTFNSSFTANYAGKSFNFSSQTAYQSNHRYYNKPLDGDFSPIDDGLNCEASNYYSKAYLRHLMKAKEFLGYTIASVHNLAFYLWLVGEARKKIQQGDFSAWKKETISILKTKL